MLLTVVLLQTATSPYPPGTQGNSSTRTKSITAMYTTVSILSSKQGLNRRDNELPSAWLLFRWYSAGQPGIYWKVPALSESLHFSFAGVSLRKASLGILLKAYALQPGLTC